jgi:ParB family transcriptional regulator, chromosome partitioning protein
MAKAKTEKKAVRKRSRRKPVAPQSVGLSPPEVKGTTPTPPVHELERLIGEDGGSVLCAYREPFGGHWLILAALPVDRVEPTPYQRDLSEAHMGRLTDVISRLGRFLDPIIAVRAGDGRYWTPNGSHRLSAMKSLGARSIPALVIPERSTAYQILALNTEKAHNLREKSLEVIRMYRELARFDNRTEADYALEFEAPAYLTLGICYEARPRFAGGAYHPVLKRTDRFMKKPMTHALKERQETAERLLEIDEAVNDIVKRLKARGLVSPYLKPFVVARINPLRFKPKGSATPSLSDTLDNILAAARKFDPGKIKPEHLAGAGGPPETS